jgi:hypothetical protein
MMQYANMPIQKKKQYAIQSAEKKKKEDVSSHATFKKTRCSTPIQRKIEINVSEKEINGFDRVKRRRIPKTINNEKIIVENDILFNLVRYSE